MSSLQIALAESDADILRCFPVMAQLRPHLVKAEFVARVRRMQGEDAVVEAQQLRVLQHSRQPLGIGFGVGVEA